MGFYRMTTRRWMIVLAVVAFGLGGMNLWQRRRVYQRGYEIYNYRVIKRIWSIEDAQTLCMKNPHLKTFCLEWITEERQAVEYLARLKKKYEYAASHPWITVPPDPPEPEWL